MFRIGNYVKYDGENWLIVDKRTDYATYFVIMHPVTKELKNVMPQVLGVHTKTRGSKPTAEMTDKQKSYVNHIEQTLGIEFNAKDYDLLSPFIEAFADSAKHKARIKDELDYWRAEEAMFEHEDAGFR